MNMKLEQQVCSLELAKKLKELGVKQESLFYWRLGYSVIESFDNGVSLGKKGEFSDYQIEFYPKPRFTTANFKWNESDLRKLNETEVSAFTVAELGEMLPGYYTVARKDNFDRWSVGHEQLRKDFIADTEADARAKMLIYLLENGLLKQTP